MQHFGWQFLFLYLLAYSFISKYRQKLRNSLAEKISILKNQIQDAEKLKDEAKNILSDNEKKLVIQKMRLKI